MKKCIAGFLVLTQMLIVLLVFNSGMLSVMAANENDSWKSLYREKIIEITNKHMATDEFWYMPVSFYLIDIDGDGIPELFQYHSYDVSYVNNIYSIIDGSVKNLNMNNDATAGAVGINAYIGMWIESASTNKTTGETVVICGYFRSFSGTGTDVGNEYTYGELRKNGQDLTFAERFVTLGVEDENDVWGEGILTYYTSNGSPKGRTLVTEEEYARKIKAYRQRFAKNANANGKYILSQDFQYWDVDSSESWDFELISLFPENWDIYDTDTLPVIKSENVDVFLNGLIPDATLSATQAASQTTSQAASQTASQTTDQTSTQTAAQITTGNYSVVLNGNKLEFDQNPVMIKNRILVPLRKIFESLGATVDYARAIDSEPGHDNAEVITITAKTESVYLTITRRWFGDWAYYIETDGEFTDAGYLIEELDYVPPVIINDRILVPVRFIAETLGADVNWIENTQTVIINTPNNAP